MLIMMAWQMARNLDPPDNGDGIDDFLDIDSDNDGIFDVVEEVMEIRTPTEMQ